MSANVKFKLSDLPPALRLQAERLLAQDGKNNRNAGLCNGSTPAFEAVRAGSTPAPATNAIRLPKPRTPNKTEAEFNRLGLDGLGRFEAISLRLVSGVRYTPDFMYADRDNRLLLFEVKGRYKLHSHDAAAVRFKEAVAQYPEFDFFWVVPTRTGFKVTQAIPPCARAKREKPLSYRLSMMG